MITLLAASALSVLLLQGPNPGVDVKVRDGVLRIEPLPTEAGVRVRFSADGKFPAQRVPVITASTDKRPTSWRVLRDGFGRVDVFNGDLWLAIDPETAAVKLLGPDGDTVLAEVPNSRKLEPTGTKGIFRASDSFRLSRDEAIYGLGQHQDGFLDHRGSVVTLEQQNREVAIPFAVSSKGYGILWNNPAGTKVSVDATEHAPSPNELLDDQGERGGLTGHYFKGRNFDTPIMSRTDPTINFDWSVVPPPGLPHDDYSVRWTGWFAPQTTGTYSFKTVSDDGVRLWIDGKQVIDDWTIHPAQTDVARVPLKARTRHRIRLEYFQAGGQAVIGFDELRPTGTLDWHSEAAESIDYCVFYGPSIDKVIEGYRQATGTAPLPPKWALGYWQSKERYATQNEWSEIASEYRRRNHPIDVLVQDWFYWDPYPWGSHEFDPNRYPDPKAGVAELHKDHLHSVISVWGMFAPDKPGYPNRNLHPLADAGDLFSADLRGDGMRFYDAFKPAARRLYWDQIRDELFDKGFDGWWLDASEPEVNMQRLRQAQTAAGPGALVLNAWPLMHTIGVSEGQLRAAPDRRPVILTRSAYAGQQRTGAITWSGDITATWKVFADQIPAGLNFCMSGIPYWTTDIGAFFAPRNLYPGGAQDPAYRELFTRWFQYGAFCPIFRVHGTDFAKEMWRFGPDTEAVLDRYDRLRYRLMPYIYSQAWKVTSSGGTLMRGLAMDFPSDATARECKDEFMFGSALLVCPVIHPGIRTRDVYLPSGADWYDFWTGRHFKGGRTIVADAPIETMPIFVRAGSILPLGPEIQYADEKPADPIELRLYPGASGQFALYEDDGISNGYKTGARSLIPIRWDGKGRLTLGPRRGSFPGMLASRTFEVELGGPNQARKRVIAIRYLGRRVTTEVSGAPAH